MVRLLPGFVAGLFLRLRNGEGLRNGEEGRDED
jgi:hypothetical protein